MRFSVADSKARRKLRQGLDGPVQPVTHHLRMLIEQPVQREPPALQSHAPGLYPSWKSPRPSEDERWWRRFFRSASRLADHPPDPSNGLVDLRTDLDFRSDHDLGGGGGSRCAKIRDVIADRAVDFMTDSGDRRNGTGRNRPCDDFLVERPEILERSSAAADEDDVVEIPSREVVDGGSDLTPRCRSLDANGIDLYGQSLEPAAENVQNPGSLRRRAVTMPRSVGGAWEWVSCGRPRRGLRPWSRCFSCSKASWNAPSPAGSTATALS